MAPPKHLKRLKKMYEKVKSAQDWLDRHLEGRSSARSVYPWKGMSPEKTVVLFLRENGYKVYRRNNPNIDYDIEMPDGSVRSLEVKADVLRPGQEIADEYAVILYPNKDNKSKKCIILTTFEIPESPARLGNQIVNNLKYR